jgi:hypothetical protein
MESRHLLNDATEEKHIVACIPQLDARPQEKELLVTEQ